MPTSLNATGDCITGPARPAVHVELLTDKDVAALARCSTRHIRRLADTGQMPAPVRLGALVRWRRAEIIDWIGNGCLPKQNRGGAKR